MKKIVALLLSLCLILGCAAVASAETETKTGVAFGLVSDVKVEIINVQKNGLNKGFCESGREWAGTQNPFFSVFWQQF